MFGTLLICAIQLGGVTGADLRARAFFDANNVKVGDPLILTVDFLGSADFKDIHPPALSRVVSRKDWKVDDASAKTDTYRDARRLTYRVRPMREGVVWFPSLEFEYRSPDGSPRLVKANEIPVHARSGAQVVVEMAEDPSELPKPPELIAAADFAAQGLRLSADERFAWQKACLSPSADAFAAFDFPAAKLNEATCAIREGNWARAMDVYRRLEWRIGQTPEIERGIVAALALKVDNPSVELPVVRQVLRPLLRYGWMGRTGMAAGVLAALVLVFWLLGKGIRALACVALACAVVTSSSAETVETVTTNADGSVTHRKITRGGNGNFSFSFSSSSSTGKPKGGLGIEPSDFFDNWDPFGMRRSRQKRPPVEISVRLASDKSTVSVGEDFNLILTIERPHYVAFSDGIRLALAEQPKMQQTGVVQNMRNRASRNPTNVIQKMVFPMRANEPFTNLHFSVEGEYVFGNDHPFFRTATPYESGRRSAELTVRPLPTENRPEGFGGIVADGVALFETCDLLRVHTNDVITITYRMCPRGYVPAAYQPKDIAFEWTRQDERDGRPFEIEYRRYFVADGAPETPRLSVPYYDTRKGTYRTATVGGTPLKYVPDEE